MTLPLQVLQVDKAKQADAVLYHQELEPGVVWT